MTSGTGFLDLDSIVVLSATGQANETKTPSAPPIQAAMGNNGGNMGGDSTSVNNAPNKDTLHVESANGANKSVGSCHVFLSCYT